MWEGVNDGQGQRNKIIHALSQGKERMKTMRDDGDGDGGFPMKRR